MAKKEKVLHGFDKARVPEAEAKMGMALKVFDDFQQRGRAMYIRKNNDYGNSFDRSLDKFGLVAAATRMNDKFERFCTLINHEAMVSDESIEDTLADLANYALMTASYLKRKRNASENEEVENE